MDETAVPRIGSASKPYDVALSVASNRVWYHYLYIVIASLFPFEMGDLAPGIGSFASGIDKSIEDISIKLYYKQYTTSVLIETPHKDNSIRSMTFWH
jgi:hypothetical protein